MSARSDGPPAQASTQLGRPARFRAGKRTTEEDGIVGEASKVTVRIEDGIAVITIDNPPINAGSLSVRAGLVEALRSAGAAGVSGAILIGTGRAFIHSPAPSCPMSFELWRMLPFRSSPRSTGPRSAVGSNWR